VPETAPTAPAPPPGDPRLVLLGRPGCHLCDDARRVVAAVADETGTAWVERSVDDDPDLRARYGELVPVVLVDGAQHAFYRVDAARLRTALAGPRGLRHRWGLRRPTPP